MHLFFTADTTADNTGCIYTPTNDKSGSAATPQTNRAPKINADEVRKMDQTEFWNKVSEVVQGKIDEERTDIIMLDRHIAKAVVKGDAPIDPTSSGRDLHTSRDRRFAIGPSPRHRTRSTVWADIDSGPNQKVHVHVHVVSCSVDRSALAGLSWVSVI